MRFWQTLAIVNAIWAADGVVDWASIVQVGLVFWCLLNIYRLEKADRATATRPDTLT